MRKKEVCGWGRTKVFDRVRWAHKWRQTRLKLTLDLLALLQVEILQRCGPLDLAEVTCEGKRGGRKKEELGGLRLGPHGGGCSFVFDGGANGDK